MEKDFFWKNDKLGHDSVFYKEKAHIYEIFSQAEDSLKKISNYFKPLTEKNIILDLGCGTGKLIPDLAPLAKKYWALDASKYQLAIAKRKAINFSNIKFIQSSAAKIPIRSNSIDIIIANWFIGSIHNIQLRKKIIKEIRRILKLNGSIYIVENDIGGGFKNIIENNYGNKKTMVKLQWLGKNKFKKTASIKTYFKFKSIRSAKNVFTAIWGKEIANNIKSRKISHNIVIYRLGKI